MEGESNYNDIPYSKEDTKKVNETSFDKSQDESVHTSGHRINLAGEGNMYFDDSFCEETIRHGPLRDNNQSSLNGDTTDNIDIMFNPTQRLNFDDEDDTGDDEELSDGELILSPQDHNDLATEEYLNNRPLTNGSDIAENEIGSVFSRLGNDHGQNIRIIEGHDSSLVDDGAIGFNFQIQNLKTSATNGQQQNQQGLVSCRNEDSAHNLYDSLERIDSSNLVGADNQSSHENSANDYLHTAATASQNLETLNDNSDLKKYLSSLPQNYQQSQSNTDTDEQISRTDSCSMNLNRRKGSGDDPMITVGGFGGVNPIDESDDCNLELSEEGLLNNNTQLYAQPIASSAQLSAVHNFTGDGLMQFQNLQGQNQHFYDVQPKTISFSQGHSLSDCSQTSHNSDVNDLDSAFDERQAGAGSSLTLGDQNQSAGGTTSHQSVKISASSKAQTRRPAVQGSASSGSTKRASSLVNSHSGNVGKINSQSRKSGPTLSSGKGKEENKNIGQISIAVHSQGTQQSHKNLLAVTSRVNSQTSLATNSSCTNTNNRMSGVGKESQQYIFRTSAGGGAQVEKPEMGSQNDQHNFSIIPISGSIPHSSNPNKSQSMGRLVNSKGKSSAQLQVRQSQSFGLPHQSANFKHPSNNFIFKTHEAVSEGQELQFSGKEQLQQSSVPLEGWAIYPRQSLNEKIIQRHQHEQQAIHFGQMQIPSSFNPNLSPCSSDISHQSGNQDYIMSQMEAMKRQGQRFSPYEAANKKIQINNDVRGMEEVRNTLQNMLHLSTEPFSEAAFDQPDADKQASGDADQPINRQLNYDTDVNTYLGHHEDMSDILENFPTFSSKIFSDLPANPSQSEIVNGEVHHLREGLEKERYRRKHCEDQIQKLNAKLLETQQQLAVAVSTDKRKDSMIEQLDKQLAKVVEGWKKRESEKDDYIKVLTQEKEQIEETLQKQQKMINNFERDLSQTVEELRIEKEHSSKAVTSVKKELNEAKEQMEKSEAHMESERQKFSTILEEWEELKLKQELAEQRALQAQEQLIKEQDGWILKEKELNDKIIEVKDANQKVINMEKIKHEEQKKRREECEAQLEEMKTELRKVVLDMEQLIREKESQKVEMAIMEAKAESAQRKLETDLHVQMEKEIADQAKEFHSKLETTMEEVSDRHRKQVGELQARHHKDMERQTAVFNQEREKKEEENRNQIEDYEEKLKEIRNENSALKQSKLKLESQRMEILTKLQFMMQSQWNEAVSLLVSTPQKKNLNSSFMSSQSSVQQPVTSNDDAGANTALTNLDLITPRPAVSANVGESIVDSHPHQDMRQPPPGDCHNGEADQRMDRVEEYLNSLADSRNTQLDQIKEQSLKSEDFGIGLNRPNFRTDNQILTYNTQIGQDCRPLLSNKTEPEMTHTAVAMRPPHQSSSQSINSGAFSRNHVELDSIHRSNLTSQQRFNPPSQNSILQHNAPTRHIIHADQKGSQYEHRKDEPHMFSQGDLPSLPHMNSQNHLPLQTHPPETNLQHKLMDVADVNIYHPESCVTHNLDNIPGYGQWPPQDLRPEQHVPDNMMAYGNVHSQFRKESSTNLSPLSPLRVSRSRTSSQASALSASNFTQKQQTTSLNERLNESLSPPVKQSSAQRESEESYSPSAKPMMDEDRLKSNCNQFLERTDTHENRHSELGHYVKMLLSKAPGSVYAEPERDYPSEILESSRDLTVDLDLNDTDQAYELNAQLRRLQHLRERQNSQPEMLANREMFEERRQWMSQGLPDYLNDMTANSGVISSQRLSEISNCLSLYREKCESNPDEAIQQNMAGQIMQALTGMTENSHKMDRPSSTVNRREQMIEESTKAYHMKKSKESSKIRKVKNANQSADSSVADSGGSDKSNNTRTSRKQSSDIAGKDRKSNGQKQNISKNSSGPVWK